MNLGDFKSLLRDAIKRGDSYDSQLDGFARRAARWIEQNHTLQYMRRRIVLTSVQGDIVIPLPTNVSIKSLEYLRFAGTDGTRIECHKGELSDPDIEWTTARYGTPEWPSNSRAGLPSRFYLDGVESLVFDRAWPEELEGQGIMARYSDFPRSDNHTHWLLVNAEGLMLRQALIEFLTIARDDRGYTVALAQREQDIKALLNADYETRYTGQDLDLTA